MRGAPYSQKKNEGFEVISVMKLSKDQIGILIQKLNIILQRNAMR